MSETVLKEQSLKGKNAFVTGGSRGIGRATALALAEAGANVCIAVAHSLDEANEVVEDVKKLGADSFAIVCDVANADDVQGMVDMIVQRWGTVDIAINNAGIVNNAAAEDMALSQWQRMIDVNLTGVFLCSQSAGRAMIKGGTGGVIINVSSICASIVVAPQKQCHYNAAKGGVNMLSKTLAVEWAEHGIRVNTVSPGYIGTKLVAQMHDLHPTWTGKTPMKRLGEPQEIADVIVFLASPKASFVTGSEWIADGGYVAL